MLAYSHCNPEPPKSFKKFKRSVHPYVKGTICLNLPDKVYLENLLNSYSNKGLIQIGHTICSNKDQYNKKTGRELAEKRIVWCVTDFTNIEIRGIKKVWHFQTETISPVGSIRIEFGLSTVAESDKVQLVYAYFP